MVRRIVIQSGRGGGRTGAALAAAKALTGHDPHATRHDPYADLSVIYLSPHRVRLPGKGVLCVTLATPKLGHRCEALVVDDVERWHPQWNEGWLDAVKEWELAVIPGGLVITTRLAFAEEMM